MEDFGYSKQQEESATNSIIKRAFLIGATLFSIACFVYVTINAYYFVYQDGDANVETIKADADPIKVVEQEEVADGDKMHIDSTVYEDIFGNKKYAKEKEVHIRESSAPALPPKNYDDQLADASALKKSDNKQFVTSAQNGAKATAPNANAAAKNKSGQIIVYSENSVAEDKSLLPAVPKTNAQVVKSAVDSAAAAKQAALKNSGKKYIRVQIAALTSRDTADEYWDKLQRLHPGLFSGLKSVIEQVDLGKRGIFYRLQVGSFFDQVKAEEFCNRYVAQTQKSKADCIVVE